jgi:hypothetical protein
MSDKVKNNNTQELAIEVAGHDINITLTREHFNKFTNEMSMSDKVAPSHNFLARCVDADSKTALMEYINATPGSEIELAGALSGAYKPDTQIVVKPRSNAATK